MRVINETAAATTRDRASELVNEWLAAWDRISEEAAGAATNNNFPQSRVSSDKAGSRTPHAR